MPLSDYEITIGIEVHVQLATRTKMFCGCEVKWAATPNTRICPVCLGLPGALPVVNRGAVELGIRAAHALGAELATHTKFDRKNYFYPDLAKGYQISQYDQPLARKGVVRAVRDDGTSFEVKLERGHLEEDTGKNEHGGGVTLIDYNRCGVPLMEIVSDPDITSPEDGHAYVSTLRRLLQYAGVSGCNMERGEMRCDANISLRPPGQKELGDKVEVKNMNSIRAVRSALEFEAWRQAAVLDAGGTIAQETRGWRTGAVPDLVAICDLRGGDPSKLPAVPPEIRELGGWSAPQRSKEFAHDYRYFPEPDLPPLEIADGWVADVRESAAENPYDRLARYQERLGLPEYQAKTLVLDSDKALADWFEQVVQAGGPPKRAADVVLNQVMSTLNERSLDIEAFADVTPLQAAQLAQMLEAGELQNQTLTRLYDHVLGDGPDADVRALAESHNLITREGDTGELLEYVRKAIGENADAVADVRAGKRKAANKIMGHVMKATNRQYRPQQILDLLEAELATDA